MNPSASPAHRPAPRPFGDHLRHWRQHRRLSQLDLAQEAEISTRHLSFVETGRSVPSREMVLRLGTERPVSTKLRWRVEISASCARSSCERRRCWRQCLK